MSLKLPTNAKLTACDSRPRSLRLRHLAEYFIFRLLCCVVGMLSPRMTRSMARGLTGFLMALPPKLTRAAVARENLRIAFPHATDAWIESTRQAMWVHLFRLVAEIIQFERRITLENSREVITFRNRNECVKAMCSGRTVLFLGGHYGNWEASMMAFGLFGFPMGMVARDLDNPHLHRWFARTRQQASGHRVYAKKGDFDGINEQLRLGGWLALLCDQDAGKRGIFADFFGKPASTFKSLALLALEYDALIVVGYGVRLADDFRNSRWTQFEIGCEAVIDSRDAANNDPVGDLTRRYTTALESAVRRAPEQYFWVHRRWKSEPRKRKVKAALPKAA